MKIQFFVCPQTILVLQSVPVIPDKSLLQGRLISGLISQQDGRITQVHFFTTIIALLFYNIWKM